MGAVCCCLRVEDFEDYVNPRSSIYRNCICLRCFIQSFLDAYTAIFRRGDMHAIPSSIQGETSLTTTSSLDNCFSDVYRSPPRPLPYDADPRRSRSQHERLVSRSEKGSTHSHEESEPLTRSDSDVGFEYRDKWNGTESDRGSKKYRSESTMKLSSAKGAREIGYVYSSPEDEDICPTCLEEYTPENPKIMTQCSHHFHLGCIYEWMERSDSCPVCGKVMAFDETT